MSDFAATKVHAQVRLSQSAREWVVAFALSLVLVLIVTLPYFLGYELARPGTQFMGTLMNPEDSNSYLAKMQQGYEGAWLYSIPYTSLAHSREFLGGFYLLLGHLARTLGLSLMTMWHLARFGFGLVLCLATFAFVRAFVPDPRTRWLAFLLALTGSGLGWVLFLAGQNYWLGNFPVDFKMPESHLFFTLLTFPHFMVGTILLLAVIWLELRVLSGGGGGPAVAGGLVNLALAVVYPFLIYLAAAVVILNWAALVVDRVRETKGPGQMQGKALRLWREAAQAGLAFLLPLPLLIYYARVLQTNSVFAAWDAQSITPSPHPLHYLFAFFPLIALAVPTLREVRYRGLWLWVLAVALLIYAPLNPQRRFVEGIHIPLSILAAAGLAGYFLPRLRSTRAFEWLSQRPGYSPAGLERLVLIFILVVFSLSNLYVIFSTSVTMAIQQPYPFFREDSEVQAVDWAGVNVPPGSVVLAAYETGSLIPTRTNLRVVLGHWAETPDFEVTYEQVDLFYTPSTPDSWRNDWLALKGVDYVLMGPNQPMGGSLQLDSVALVPIYQRAGVTIWRHRP